MGTLPVGREHRVDRESLGRGLVRELEAARPAVRRVRHLREGVEVHRATGGTGEIEDEIAVVVVVAVEKGAGDELDRAPPVFVEHGCQRDELDRRRMVRRHAPAVVRDVQLELRRREPVRTIVEGLAQERLHRRDLVGRRVALRRVVAHHVAPQRAVPDVGGHVHTDAAFEAVEEVAERAAREVDAGRQRVGRHPLDPAEHEHQPRDVVGAGRGEGEPAVPGEEGRHTVPRGR